MTVSIIKESSGPLTTFKVMKQIARLFRVALIAFGAAAMICGCGKKMAPIPPDSLVPGEVRNFSVRQDGQALSLQWLFPRVNIDNQPLTDIQGFRILRNQESLTSSAGCPPELNPLAKIDLAYLQVGEVQGEQVRYRDENLEPGYRYFYQIVGFDRGEHLGLASPVFPMSGISCPSRLKNWRPRPVTGR